MVLGHRVEDEGSLPNYEDDEGDAPAAGKAAPVPAPATK